MDIIELIEDKSKTNYAITLTEIIELMRTLGYEYISELELFKRRGFSQRGLKLI